MLGAVTLWRGSLVLNKLLQQDDVLHSTRIEENQVTSKMYGRLADREAADTK